MPCKRMIVMWSSFTAAFLTASAMAHANEMSVVPGKLTVGIDLTFPPYNWSDEHYHPQGIDTTFMTLIARELNLRVDIQDTRFVSLLPGVERQRFDAAASMIAITPDRLENVVLIPYLRSGEALLVRRDAMMPPVVASALCGQRVAVVEHATWRSQLERQSAQCVQQGNKPLHLRVFDTHDHAMDALVSGRVDVHVTDSAVAAYEVQQRQGEVRVSSTSLLYAEDRGIAVSKDRPELATAIVQAITRLQASGEYQALLKRYGVEAINMALTAPAR